MKKILFGVSLLALPISASAQSLQEWLPGLFDIINNVVLPFILALAFLFFIWNAFRFFILEGDSEDGQKKAKQLMIWGIAGFVIILTLIGITRLLVGTFGLGGKPLVCPDYNPFCATQGPPRDDQTSDFGYPDALPDDEEDPLEAFGGTGEDVRDDRDPLGDDMKNK